MAAVEVNRQETTEQDQNRNIYTLNVGNAVIPVNLGYIKSKAAILAIASLILSLTGFICIAATYQRVCDFVYGSTYKLMEFVTMSWFIITIFRFIFSTLSHKAILCLELFQLRFVELMLLGVYILFFLVASSLIAVHACWQDGYKVAAAVGFLCMVVLVLDCMNTSVRLQKEHPPTQNKLLLLMGIQQVSPCTVPEYNPTTNIETRY